MNISDYTFSLLTDWDLIASLSKIDYFDGYWNAIQKKENLVLERIKSVTGWKNAGASTRISGSRMSDEQVSELLENRNNIPDNRDCLEVAGYYDTLELITGSYEDINITENGLKTLHSICLRYINKYQWYYKFGGNSVEAFRADGTKQMIFQTADPGPATEDAMDDLIKWYNADDKIHPLVKCGIFIYIFERIHPFQDANGRMSRLLTSLLLLKNGYKWIQYISFDQEIESRKTEYYRALRKYPFHEKGEDISSWIQFFLDRLINVQQKLLEELKTEGTEARLSPRERSILILIGDSPGCRSGEIAERSGIPNPTIKRLLSDLYSRNLIERYGSGPRTNYTVK